MKGILGTKLGMTQVFDENNRIVPVTVVKAGPNVVTQIRTQDNDGYVAVQLAFGAIDPRKVNKPETGHFRKAGVTPRRYLVELRTESAGEYEVGQELGPDDRHRYHPVPFVEDLGHAELLAQQADPVSLCLSHRSVAPTGY